MHFLSRVETTTGVSYIFKIGLLQYFVWQFCFKIFIYTKNRSYKFQNARAGFVFNKHFKIKDALELKWLTIEERNFSIDIFVKTLHEEEFSKHDYKKSKPT